VLHGLASICHEAGNGGYIGSHCPKQSRASSLLGGEFSSTSGLASQSASVLCEPRLEVGAVREPPLHSKRQGTKTWI